MPSSPCSGPRGRRRRGTVSASAFVCPNRSCGVSTGARPVRTQLGRVYGDLLVVSSVVEPAQSSDGWQLVCPVCGRRIWWSGSVAVMVERKVA